MTGPTISAVDSGAKIFGHNVSDMQANVSAANGRITGTLKKLTSGSLVDTYGHGYFMALQWANVYASATSLKVGLMPSMGTGLVEAIDDPDHNGAFKVTDKDMQHFVVVTSDGTNERVDVYDLTGLVFATE